jgi:hypothetical protein
MKAFFVRDKLVHYVCLGAEGRYIVCLISINEFTHVICLGLDGDEYRAVANGAIWAEDNEVVWEFRGCETEVGVWFCSPCVLQVCARGVGDGEAGREGGVEASCADEDVEGVLGIVGGLDATWSYLCDFAEDGCDVGFAEGFEVTGA